MPQPAPNSRTLAPCFVICPIHDERTPDRAFIRWKVNFLLEKVVKPVMKQAKFRAVTMEERGDFEWIPEGMVDRLSQDTVAVAILEGLLSDLDGPGSYSDSANANVLYELGLRHAWCRQTIVLCPDRATFKLPFDLRDVAAGHYPPFRRTAPDATDGHPLSDSQIKSLRNQLQRKLTSSPNADFVRQSRQRYHRGLLYHQERFGMAMILEMKHDLLKVTLSTLDQFEVDVRNDYDLKGENPEALRALSDTISQPQKLILTQIGIYREIADRRLKSMQGGKFALALCEKLRDIALSMSELVSMMKTPKGKSIPTKDRVIFAIRKLKNEVKSAQELGENLEIECNF
jgi:hypothetical protein